MNKYKDLAKEFRKEFIEHFGKKCKDFDFGCMVCQSHRIIDDLENLSDCMDDFNKHNRKNKK